MADTFIVRETALSLNGLWKAAEQHAIRLMHENGYTKATIDQGNTKVVPPFHSETFPSRTVVVRDVITSTFEMTFTITLAEPLEQVATLP